jgi:hypothetical protein
MPTIAPLLLRRDALAPAPAMPAASGERASGWFQKSTLMLRRKSPAACNSARHFS